mgnify:CR=1 FL=1
MSKSRFSLMLFVVLSSFVLTVTSTYAIRQLNPLVTQTQS